MDHDEGEDCGQLLFEEETFRVRAAARFRTYLASVFSVFSVANSSARPIGGA
jgi:hypothetical protein